MEEELNRFFIYISEIATSIRMNSDYCSMSIESEATGQNVMWLSDMLHNTHLVGEALQNGSKGVAQIKELKETWISNKEDIEQALRNSPPHHSSWTVEQGVEILDSIAYQLTQQNLRSK